MPVLKRYNSSTSTWEIVGPATPEASSVSLWNKVVDVSLSSLTQMTIGTGTWNITDGVLRQSATGASTSRATPIPKVDSGEVIVEVEIKMDAGPSTANSRAGISFAGQNGGPLVAFIAAQTGFMSHLNLENEGILNLGSKALTAAIPFGTWGTLRVHRVGNMTTSWVNGLQIGSTWHNVDRDLLSVDTQPSLYTYNSDSSFRNLKIWTPNLDVDAMGQTNVHHFDVAGNAGVGLYIGPAQPAEPTTHPIWIKTS